MSPRAAALAALLSLSFALAGGSSAAIVTRGPYLQLGTPTGVVVRWRTLQSTDARVLFGTSPAALSGVATSSAIGTEHEVGLASLSPATRYWYAVGNADSVFAGDTTYTFVTPPLPGTAGGTRFWVLGDSGLPGSVQTQVMNGFRDWTGSRLADCILMLGDNAYNGGTDGEYQAGVFTPYASWLRKMVLWSTRGNHDLLYAGANNDYYEFFTMPAAGEAGGVPSGSEAYYSFDWANVHLVCLDSEASSRLPGGAMLQWLREDLASTTRDWVIAFWHQPPYSKGSHDSDQYNETNMREMRTYVLPVLDSLGVDLVLCGHSHSYERSFLLKQHYGVSTTLASGMIVDGGNGRVDGTGAYRKATLGPAAFEGAVYVVAGSSSRTGGGTLNHPVMVSSQNRAGSLVVDVNGPRLDVHFIDFLGIATDYCTLLKAGAVDVGSGPFHPADLAFTAGRPNPFRDRVELGFRLPRAGRARITVHDVDGRRVASVLDGELAAGDHAARWNGRDAAGRPVPPGVYFGVLDSGGEKRARRLVKIR